MISKISKLLLAFLLLASPSIAAEDWTAAGWAQYNEESSANFSTYTANALNVLTESRKLIQGIAGDYTAGYFGNVDHDIQCKVDHYNNWMWIDCLNLSNSSAPTETAINTANEGIRVYNYVNDTPAVTIRFKEAEADTSDSYAATDNTTYYLSLIRTSTTLNLYIYSDSARTTLLDTLTVTRPSTTYRYAGVCFTPDSGTSDERIESCTANNLTFNADPDPPAAGGMIIDNQGGIF